MTTTVEIALDVNGERRILEVEPRRVLADVLRDGLDLRSVHLGCEHGACGACTVLIDGEPAASCNVLAVQADRRSVTTLEGLNGVETMQRLQDAFHRHFALQCGFCTPGALVSLYSFLEGRRADTQLTEREVRLRLGGNLCRCTGYGGMVMATIDAAGSGDELSALPGVGAQRAAALREGGVTTIRELAEAPIAKLTSVQGIGRRTAEALVAAARDHLGARQVPR